MLSQLEWVSPGRLRTFEAGREGSDTIEPAPNKRDGRLPTPFLWQWVWGGLRALPSAKDAPLFRQRLRDRCLWGGLLSSPPLRGGDDCALELGPAPPPEGGRGG